MRMITAAAGFVYILPEFGLPVSLSLYYIYIHSLFSRETARCFFRIAIKARGANGYAYATRYAGQAQAC